MEAACVSDFRPSVIPLLATLPKLRCLALWGGPLVDLRGFGTLNQLEHLIVFGASRLRSLEGIEELRSLRTLRLAGISGVKHLDPLSAMPHLRALELEAGLRSGTLPDRTKFKSLGPLKNLKRLKILRIWGLRTEDDDLNPIAGLGPLEEIELPDWSFPIQAMATAAAAYPQVRERWSRPLDAVVPCGKCGEKKAVLFGRGTRDICPTCSPEKIDSFLQRFNALVEQHKRGSTP